MPRRKRDDGGVSLFPFMSVLASLIGILTLLIAANMIANQKQQEGMTQEEVDKAKEYKKLKNQISDIELENLEKEKKLEQENKTVFEMAKIKDRKIVLKNALDEVSQTDNEENADAELQKMIENLTEESTALKTEHPDLKKQLEELKAELKERKIQPKPTESVVIRPGGVGTKIPRNLFFVEANSTGIIVREHKELEQPFTVSTAAIETNDDYGNFCQHVFNTQDSMILFLVRKSGNDAYLWGAGFAENQFGVRTGKLPVPNDGEIDLSLFDKKK